MPKFIAHHGGKFFEWSTIVDAPVTVAMDRSAFEEYIRSEYGAQGLRDLPSRIERAIKNGTSDVGGMSLQDLIAGNRAGPSEKELDLQGILSLVNQG